MRQPYPSSGLALARRLERAEGHAGAKFVEARARVFPASGTSWMEVAGAYAMYDGAASPITQTFGLGLFDPIREAELEAVESFFRDRGAPAVHEVSPLAGVELLDRLTGLGYQPVELTSVMYRPIPSGDDLAWSHDSRILARPIGADESELWARTTVRGWSDAADLSEFVTVQPPTTEGGKEPADPPGGAARTRRATPARYDVA